MPSVRLRQAGAGQAQGRVLFTAMLLTQNSILQGRYFWPHSDGGAFSEENIFFFLNYDLFFIVSFCYYNFIPLEEQDFPRKKCKNDMMVARNFRAVKWTRVSTSGKVICDWCINLVNTFRTYLTAQFTTVCQVASFFNQHFRPPRTCTTLIN